MVGDCDVEALSVGADTAYIHTGGLSLRYTLILGRVADRLPDRLTVRHRASSCPKTKVEARSLSVNRRD